MHNKYILMRHGETKYQARKRDAIYRKSEQFILPITKNGKKKIKQVAKELSFLGIGLIYCSDYFRTRQTARIVAKPLGLKVIFDKRLRDTNFGVFHGKSGDDYRKFFSKKKERFSKRTPQGENWRDVRKRVVNFINEIDKKHKNKIILIITHADPSWLLAGYLKGLNEEELLEKRHVSDLWPDVGQYLDLTGI